MDIFSQELLKMQNIFKDDKSLSFSYKSNKSFENNLIYKKEIKSESDSLFVYFHGNAEFVDYIFSPPFIELLNKNNIDYSIYEYPGYFNTKLKYKNATIENFIDYSKEIAKDIINSDKKEIYLIGWSLGVWVCLLVLNNLKKHILSRNINVKVVLINGFYDLYQFIEEFGRINPILGLIPFIYKYIVIKFLKKCIGKYRNNVLSNFKLVKFISNIANIRYINQESIDHDDIFFNSADKNKIKKFLNTKFSNKNIELLLTSAKGDLLTGKGMFKL